MIPLIKENRDALEALCRQFDVARFEVFGSAADDTFDPQRSDLDFLVEFQAQKPESLADNYFGLLDALQELFGRKIDLVTPKSIRNRFFLEAVNQTRQVVYAA